MRFSHDQWMLSIEYSERGNEHRFPAALQKGQVRQHTQHRANLYLVKNKNKEKKWNDIQMVRSIISANQHVFVENRSNINPTTFFEEITGLADKGNSVDTIQLTFHVGFSTI